MRPHAPQRSNDDKLPSTEQPRRTVSKKQRIWYSSRNGGRAVTSKVQKTYQSPFQFLANLVLKKVDWSENQFQLWKAYYIFITIQQID